MESVASPTQTTTASSLAQSSSERRLVSVLFVDLVGFTPLSEGRDAEEVRDLLSRYFEVARGVVERYGGMIEKFIGDAVMAMWGSPTAREDDAERAVRAGLDLVAAVAALGADEGVVGLAARGGVATGEAAVNRNAEGEGMVMGDLVNTASRVQSVAPEGTVFVTGATKRTSDAAIAYEEAGEHELKGKKEPLALFQAMRVVAGRGGAIRAAGLEPPFVGRDRDLRLLKDLFHASADGGAAHLVSVLGIGGIGKSRLSWELEKYLDGLVGNVWWHRGRCLPYGEGVAYWALAEMVRSRVGAAEEEEPATTLARLKKWLDRWCSDMDEKRWLEAQLGQLLGLGERDAAPREELFTAWERFFGLLAERGPVVMVFEDLQWADSGLLDFLDQLLARAGDRPLYVLALARPEIADRRPGWGSGRHSWTSMTLGPLRDADMDWMLRGMVPGMPDELVTRVRERAEGVPLYAVETVRMLLDRGVLQRTTDGVELAPDAAGSDLDVPETLQALIGARLDDLPEAERSLLQHASVLGKTFTVPALSAITGEPDSALEPMLADLVRKEHLAVIQDPLSPDRGQYGFLQSIVQRVVYDTVSHRDRKIRHLAVARHLEEAWGGDDADIAELVAAHYVEAYEAAPGAQDAREIRGAARAALERAGRRALSLTATTEAAAYFDRASAFAEEELDRARLSEQAANAVWVGGDAEQAIARFDTVIEAYGRLGHPLDAARARSRVGEALWAINRVEDALARMEDAYAVLPSTSDRDIAALAGQLGRMRYFASKDPSDLDRALEPIERALGISEELFLPGTLSDALNTKALILGSLDRPEESLALLLRALDIALENDETYPAIRAYTNLSNEMSQRDQLERASAYQEAGAALAERTGYLAAWWFLQSHRAEYLNWTGRWDELEALCTRYQDHRTEPAAVAGASLIMASWIEVQGVGRGHVEEAHVIAAEQIHGLEDSDDFQTRAFAVAVMASVAIAEGDHREAIARTLPVVLSPGVLGPRHWVFKFAAQEALEASLALGDLEQAEEILGRLQAIPPSGGSPLIEAWIAGYGARLGALRNGDTEHIDAGFREAARRLGEMERHFYRAQFLLTHAEWLTSLGRNDEAAPLAEEAAAIFTRLRATPWSTRTQRLHGAAV